MIIREMQDSGKDSKSEQTYRELSGKVIGVCGKNTKIIRYHPGNP